MKNRLSNSLSTGLLYNIRNIPKWTLYSYTFFILNNGLESLHSLEVFEHTPHGSFPFVICLVNVSKSADNCGLQTCTKGIIEGKLFFRAV